MLLTFIAFDISFVTVAYTNNALPPLPMQRGISEVIRNFVVMITLFEIFTLNKKLQINL